MAMLLDPLHKSGIYRHPKGFSDSNGWCKAVFSDKATDDIPFGWSIFFKDPAKPTVIIMEHLSDLLSDKRVQRGYVTAHGQLFDVLPSGFMLVPNFGWVGMLVQKGNVSLGKLGTKVEPAGKIRVFAMVDA